MYEELVITKPVGQKIIHTETDVHTKHQREANNATSE